MSFEALLPSEIARLVYGYLVYEKCTNAAKTFLDESPNLEECRHVLTIGRRFTTRLYGCSLLDILERFCTIHVIVQEKIDKSDKSDKLRRCLDIISQIKCLIEEYKGHKYQPTNELTSPNQSPLKSHKKCSFSWKDDHKLKNATQLASHEVQTNLSQTQSTAVEATLLQNLPGYVNNSEPRRHEIEKQKSSKKLKTVEAVQVSQSIPKENEALFRDKFDLCRNNLPVINSEENSKKYSNSYVQTSENVHQVTRLDKNIMTDNVSNLNYVSTETQTCNESDFSENVSPYDVLTDIMTELLARRELQEKIAENINKVINTNDVLTKETDNSYFTRYNKAVEAAVDISENDPDILNLLNEICFVDEDLSSTGDELDAECKRTNIPEGNSNAISMLNVSNAVPVDKKIEIIESKVENDLLAKPQLIEKVFVTNEPKPTSISELSKVPDDNKFCHVMLPEKQSLTVENNIVVNEAQSNLDNNKTLLTALESPIYNRNIVNKPESCFLHNTTVTSTPLKAFSAVENFESCNWFSTQDIPTPSLDYHKEIGVTTKLGFSFSCNAIETIVSPNLLSPVILKDAIKVPETINCSSTNRAIDQTLNTPEIVYAPKISINSVVTTNTIIPVQKINSPMLQKNSEVMDELLSLQPTAHKSNGNSINLSTLLKDNSGDFNKYLNTDSIMLCGIESNQKVVQNSSIASKVAVENSFSGEGLSPFLKFHNKPEKPNVEKENVKTVETTVTNQNPLHTAENCIEKNVDNSSIIKINDTIVKNTPKALLESRAKNNRLSLSTPKKPNSHIRILNFETPLPTSQSENKKDDIAIATSQIIQSLKDSCKSSLFQSPPLTNTNIIENNVVNYKPLESVAYPVSVPQVSTIQDKQDTNKPVQKDTNKIVPLDVNKVTSAAGSSISKAKPSLKRTTDISIEKKSWDSDLRKYLGDYDVKPPVQPKRRKKNAKTPKKGSENNQSKKATENNTTEKSDPDPGANSEKKTNDAQENSNKIANNLNSKETMKKSATSKRKKKPDNPKKLNIKRPEEAKENSPGNKTKNRIVIKRIEKVNINTKIITIPNEKPTTHSLEVLLSEGINNDKPKEVIETISLNTTEESECNTEKQNDSSSKSKSDEDLQDMAKDIEKFFEMKHNLSSNTEQKKEEVVPLENKETIDYMKIENELSILTNAEEAQVNTSKESVIYDEVSKIESGKIIQKKYARLKTLETNIGKSKRYSPLVNIAFDFDMQKVDSMQRPPTPQVLSSSNSNLTLPFLKFNEDSRTVHSVLSTNLECPPTPTIILTPPKAGEENTREVSQKSEVAVPYCEPSQKSFKGLKDSDIISYKVIKENLPKEKSRSQNVSQSNSTKNDINSVEEKVTMKSKTEETSKVSSSSSSCDSCSTSSSSSSSEDEVKKQESDHQVSEKKNIKVQMEKVLKIELSPLKVFKINKTDKEIAESMKETPAKEDNPDIEVDIFETPNVSKPIDQPTNLNDKISHIMNLKEKEEAKKLQGQSQITGKEETITKPMTQLTKLLPTRLQQKSTETKVKLEKNEEETAKAIESLIKHTFEKDQDKSRKSPNSDSPKVAAQLDVSISPNEELEEAIESITKIDYDKVNKIEKIFKKEDTKSKKEMHSYNTRSKTPSKVEKDKFHNSSSAYQEICLTFEEDKYKKKRRKPFNEEDLTYNLHDNQDKNIKIQKPSKLDIIFAINPARKKPIRKTVVTKKTEKVCTDEDSQNSLPSLRNRHKSKPGTSGTSK